MGKCKASFSFVEPEPVIEPEKKHPASYLRKTFMVEQPIKSALLQMTGLGVYQGYFNGEALDEQTLTPGHTDYNHRVQYIKTDVTNRMVQGENVIAAILGDGWYRGCLSIGSHRNCYGTKTKLACRLEITFTDGKIKLIETDESWKATQKGPVRENDLKTIEYVDARMEMPGWNTRGFNDDTWHNVVMGTYSGAVIPQEGEKILEQERFKPTVLKTPNGEMVLDFEQNMAGRVTFTVTGSSGHKVKLVMGETLDEHGNFTMKNMSAKGSGLISGEMSQDLHYILKDGIQTYKPQFLISGFRYVLLENWPEKVDSENFTATAIYSDCAQVGSFTCSNPLINRLVENIKWSQRSNFVDIPTDCPTRERSGWTADIMVFCETACYLTDAKRFLVKWLNDFMLEQGEDGSLPFIVPAAGKGSRARSCAGWSDALCEVPMMLYNFYGDINILKEVYEPVKRFVQYNVQRAKKKNKWLFYKLGRHRKYVVETGFHYGEWIEPGREMYQYYIKALFVPDTEVTTAWFFHTVKRVSEMANLLGKVEDNREFDELAESIRLAYRKEFLPNGQVRSDRHCRFVRPVVMGLADRREKAQIMKQLNEKCIENNYKIGTGFLTTYKILSLLSDYGYVDTAYKMLENTKQPGWLYAVTKGATTIWENWYGVDDKGVPNDSHNHYAPGSVGAWLFSHCAGIRPLKPGFNEILIKPMPGGTLTHAKASYVSIHGEIVSEWELKDGKFTLDIQVPQGIYATVALPNNEEHHVEGGAHRYTCNH